MNFFSGYSNVLDTTIPIMANRVLSPPPASGPYPLYCGVYGSGLTTLSSIYTVDGGDKNNPFFVDSAGYFSFYAPAITYDAVFSRTKPTGVPASADVLIVYVTDYGAVGDGVADDTVAIQSAITAAANYAVVEFPAPSVCYLIDGSFVIDKPLTLRGDNATIKLKDQSSLFLNATTEEALFWIQSDDVVIDGLFIDGNSRGNYVTVGGIRQYFTAAPTRQVSLIFVGFFAGHTTNHRTIHRIAVRNCVLYDAPFASIDSYSYPTYQDDVTVEDNVFVYGQADQMSLGTMRRCTVRGNKHEQPYEHSVHVYYYNEDCQIDGNTVYFNSSELDTSATGPMQVMHAGEAGMQFGAMVIGKSDGRPDYGILVSNNVLRGAPIHVIGGLYNSDISHNLIDRSEEVGISVDANPGAGVRVSQNTIMGCAQPGLYLSSTSNPIEVTDNYLRGNNTSAAQYGGRDCFANILVISDHYHVRRNVCRVDGSAPVNGVHYFSGTAKTDYLFQDNDIIGSGSVSDYKDGATSSSPTGTSYWVTFTDGDTTPTIDASETFIANNASPTTIANFVGGYQGKAITVYFSNGNTTVDRSNALLAGAVNFVGASGDFLRLSKKGNTWFEMGRETTLG